MRGRRRCRRGYRRGLGTRPRGGRGGGARSGGGDADRYAGGGDHAQAVPPGYGAGGADHGSERDWRALGDLAMCGFDADTWVAADGGTGVLRPGSESREFRSDQGGTHRPAGYGFDRANYYCRRAEERGAEDGTQVARGTGNVGDFGVAA